ncbi:HIT family protein [Nitrosarchaeum sp.]|uniref:HIT family protein n=1 Tax=Nitrosarchaeum sp. TaxID=2026886 RepID=UPI00247C9332|nr:HIT family protein [Nitrosarchaeum sp.]MCV0411388.1 HIT family protein [Nitrosarchaeum sp.]
MTDKCLFCSHSDQIQYFNDSAISFFDKYPVTKYHILIIPKRHVPSFFNLTVKEQLDCITLANHVKSQLCTIDETISGFNLGINDGTDAGQTIPHCHIHLIPRRKNDIESPMGGIRHIFPEKGYYGKFLKMIQT